MNMYVVHPHTSPPSHCQPDPFAVLSIRFQTASMTYSQRTKQLIRADTPHHPNHKSPPARSEIIQTSRNIEMRELLPLTCGRLWGHTRGDNLSSAHGRIGAAPRIPKSFDMLRLPSPIVNITNPHPITNRTGNRTKNYTGIEHPVGGTKPPLVLPAPEPYCRRGMELATNERVYGGHVLVEMLTPRALSPCL